MTEKIGGPKEGPAVKRRRKPYTWEGFDGVGETGERTSFEDLKEPEEEKAEQIADELVPKLFKIEKDFGRLSQKEKQIEEKIGKGKLISANEAALLRSRSKIKGTEIKQPAPPEQLPVEEKKPRSFHKITPVSEVVIEVNKSAEEPPQKIEQTDIEKTHKLKRRILRKATKEEEERSEGLSLEEKIGDAEANLKNQYLELFRLIKAGNKAPNKIYENIQLDINELERFYLQSGIKRRSQFGEILDRIKIEAQEEVGYKTEKIEKSGEIKKKAKTKRGGPLEIKEEKEIINGEKLLKEYSIESLEQLEELEKQLKNEAEK